MAVTYRKLWHILLDKNMKKKDLEAASGVSHYVMTKMSKNEDVSTEALRNICCVLKCKPEDIMEFTDD